MDNKQEEPEKRRSWECVCLQDSVLLESTVIALTFVSVLAITGELLIDFDLITVPEMARGRDDNSSNSSRSQDDVPLLRENDFVMDIMQQVFHYTSLGIAALFTIEISLKVFTLQLHFLSKCWQVLDGLVVLAALGAELTCHFLELPSRSVTALTYVIVLRLWRLPMVCQVRARAVRREMEDEMESCRTGTHKAQARCAMLEESLVRQAEIVRHLELALHAVTGTALPDETNNDRVSPILNYNNVGTALLKSEALQGNSHSHQQQGHSNPSGAKGSNKRSFLRRTKKDIMLPGDINTGIEMSPMAGHLIHAGTYDETESSISTKVKHFVRSGHNREDQLGTKLKLASLESSESTPFQELSPGEEGGRGRPAYTADSLPRAELTFSLNPDSEKLNKMNLKLRKRRSSTSDFMDYSNMCSLDCDQVDLVDVAKDRSNSWPSLESGLGAQSPLLACLGGQHDVDAGQVDDPLCPSPDRLSEASTPSGSSSQREKQRRYRRFTSCPEYVYTQRMSITSDDSMLINEGHTIEDPTAYDNIGFTHEDFRLHVMADIDGTTTYRNEDGIPMTSL